MTQDTEGHFSASETLENQGALEAENSTPVSPTGPEYREQASEGPWGAETTLKAHLIVRKTRPIPRRRHVYVYDVVFEGETIVAGSPDPDFDLARALLARGITGKVILGNRTIIDIEAAAKLRTAEFSDRRSRFIPDFGG